MASRTSRVQSMPQDENARMNMVSGTIKLHDHNGLHPQQQQAPMERKTLSNITNHILSKSKHTNKATAEKETFSVKADGQEMVPLPTVKKPSRPPLRNISNGTPKPMNNSSSNRLLKSKTEQNIQSDISAFQLPPRSKLSLTEDMKNKAALWAEEGIEEVHFTGEDIEKLHALIGDKETAKHVAMTRNCQTDLPFPIFSVPYSQDVIWQSSWRPPGDVLKLDGVKGLIDDDVPCEKEVCFHNADQNTKIIDKMLDCVDYFTTSSAPRFTESWPKLREELE